MSKKAHPRALPDNEAQAVARMLRISPQKLNLVAGLIRGKKVAAALADLEFSRKRIAKDVRKCLQSAIANAENNHELDIDDLVVAEAHVGKAIVLKRFSPRGRGRMGKIMKPFAILTLALRQEDRAIRKELSAALKQAAVSKIVIERPHKKCRVTIQSARPGVVIGKKGADIETLRETVAKCS